MEKYCWDPDCKVIEALAKLEKVKKERHVKMKKESMTLSEWKKKLEYHFNRYIRLRDEGKECISCPKILTPGNYDAGHHWNKGEHPSVRFHEDNVFGQCQKCNRYFGGRGAIARDKIISRIGDERYQAIVELKELSRKYLPYEIELMIEEYKQKYKDESNRRNHEDS